MRDSGILITVLAAACFIFSVSAAGGTPRAVTLLHEFGGGADDGQSPYSQRLVSDGTKLYGMTASGGDDSLGVVFSIGLDGSAYSHLHEFPGGTGGANPFYGGPTVVGSAIYGTAFNGGANYYGVLYRHDLAVDPLILTDGFESGDTSAWSQSTLQ